LAQGFVRETFPNSVSFSFGAMVVGAGAVLVGLAFLQGGLATRLVKRHDRADRLANPTVQNCALVSPLGEAFRQSVNWGLANGLKGRSPLNVSLHTGRLEVPISGCTAGMELAASVKVAGFEEAQIASFNCQQEGDDFMTLSSRVTIGRRVETAAGVRGNWSMCGVDYPNETAVRLGGFNVDPGFRVAIKMQRQFGFFWVVHSIETLEIEHGGIDGLTCDLTGIPEFIGTPAGQMCEDIIRWLIEKIGGTLQADVEKVLNGITGQEVTEECDPEYDCDCDGTKNCGKWDDVEKQCYNSEQCDVQWRLGDVSSDQKCRCKGSH